MLTPSIVRINIRKLQTIWKWNRNHSQHLIVVSHWKNSFLALDRYFGIRIFIFNSDFNFEKRLKSITICRYICQYNLSMQLFKTLSTIRKCLYLCSHVENIQNSIESGYPLNVKRWKMETFISINHFRTNKCSTSFSNLIAHNQQSIELYGLHGAKNEWRQTLGNQRRENTDKLIPRFEIRANWNIFELGIL